MKTNNGDNEYTSMKAPSGALVRRRICYTLFQALEHILANSSQTVSDKAFQLQMCQHYKRCGGQSLFPTDPYRRHWFFCSQP